MLSWPYRSEPDFGFWGIPTSTENFCEEDYNVTRYLAEFINTLTSFSYVFYAWHGTRMVRKGKLPDASCLPYLALAGVGVFSALFHATLKVETQRCDGLSMLVAAAAAFHRVMTFKQSGQYSRRFSIALVSWLALASLAYVLRDILIIHQGSFGIVCFSVAFKTRALMRERVKDPFLRGRLLLLARCGTVCGLGGFLIWLMDNFACSQLSEIRKKMGIPWGFLLEFHGWWHILTGVASYIYMTLIEIVLTDPEIKMGSKRPDFYAWPMSILLDIVVLRRKNDHSRAKGTRGMEK